MVGPDFGLPGVERGNLLFCGAGGIAGRAAFRERRFDLGAAGAECRQHVAGDALDLESGILARLDLIAQFAHLQGQFLPVDRPDLLLKLVEGARLKAAPNAILVPRGVHDDIMGVKLRVLGAAGAVLETGDYEIAGGLPADGAAVADARGGHMLLYMRHGGFDCFAMRGDQPAVARNLGHDRHGLGRAQRHVPAGAVFKLAVAKSAKLLTADAAIQ